MKNIYYDRNWTHVKDTAFSYKLWDRTIEVRRDNTGEVFFFHSDVALAAVRRMARRKREAIREARK